MNTTIVDVLIENIKADQELLKAIEIKIESQKEEKQTIINRLKDSQKDISVLLKYANEAQQAKIEALGLDMSASQKGLNAVATVAFDIILKAKNNELTNQDLYDAYVKSLKDQTQAIKYTEFNIKCRSLFNTQKLIRSKGKDIKNSRTDIISLNGILAKKPTEKSVSKQV